MTGPAHATYLLRWRGRQEGPYPIDRIEEMLADGSIGLAHEIGWNDSWVTLRDFLEEMRETERLEQARREVETRRVKQEADRQAKERREQREAHRQAARIERQRKRIQAEKEEQRTGAKVPGQPRAPSWSSGLQACGVLLVVAGFAVAGYFFLLFDPSVESGAGRVNNFGLMADRQNGIIVGMALGIVGAVLLAVSGRGTGPRSKPGHDMRQARQVRREPEPRPLGEVKWGLAGHKEGMNPERIKSFRIHCRCKHCSGSLEFEDVHEGKRIQCPHCGEETTLFIPAGAQCPCGSCSGILEFDISDAGTTVQCPLCGEQTVLFIPEDLRRKSI